MDNVHLISGDAIIEYYDNAAVNYTVHFVKPEYTEYTCDEPFTIQPYLGEYLLILWSLREKAKIEL